MNFRDTYTENNGHRSYDFDSMCQYLEYIGKRKYGRHFRVYKEDKRVLFKLFIYSINAKVECESAGLDLNKGILLSGPIGCGKTALMNLIPAFMEEHHRYLIKTTRDVVMEFNREGYHMINVIGKSPKRHFFDDLGIELPGKYFGNECNVIAEILLHRYDNFVHSGIITHATTNLNADELEERYGNRVRSRLREMFNLIAFPSDAKDKRK